jgi:hypothetical protein
MYHIYCDGTGFEHNIIMLRQNPYINNFAKYVLRLYESHTKPHVYATAVRYTPPASGFSVRGGKLAEDDFSAILGKTMRSEKTRTSVGPTKSIRESTPTFNHLTTTPVSTEPARLTGLITLSTPSPSAPYNKTITPPNSPFATAFRTFRHVFRDLTLLTWEERLTAATVPLSSPHSLQRLRAQAFQIEPFIWRAPTAGMPIGLMPKGLEGLDAQVLDGTYVRNLFRLPGLDEPLGDRGAVGSALVREAQEAVRKAEEEEARRRDEEKMRRSVRAKEKKPNYRQPLFNGVNGRPAKDEYGRYFQRGVTGSAATMSPSLALRGASMEMSGSGSSMAASTANANGTGVGNSNSNGKRDGQAVFTQFPMPRKRWARSEFFGDY